MKIQIELEPDLKQAAEARARQMGYASLAALLKVLSANLAQQQRQQAERPAPAPSVAALQVSARPDAAPVEPTVVEQPMIPTAEQFKVWPEYFTPQTAAQDPELYLFYIQHGIIH